MYTNGITHIDMYEQTFIPWAHYFISLLIFYPTFLNQKKRNIIKEREELRSRTDGPRGEGEGPLT